MYISEWSQCCECACTKWEEKWLFKRHILWGILQGLLSYS